MPAPSGVSNPTPAASSIAEARSLPVMSPGTGRGRFRPGGQKGEDIDIDDAVEQGDRGQADHAWRR